jgi:hypothetical protein
MALLISHRQTTFWDFSGSETVRVHFLQKQEQSFVSPECEGFQVVSEHPVLLNYLEAWSHVYVSSSASEAVATLEHLAAEISSIVAPWRSSESYFNEMVEPLDLLRSGSGLLASAPLTVAGRICAVLDSSGVRYSAIQGRPARLPMQALIAGPNFVVAREFHTAGPNNSFKPKPLRGSA